MGEKLELGINDLETTYPAISAQWDRSKNSDLEPSMVLPGSGKYVWWLCPKGHSTEAQVRGRVKFGCAVCGNRQVEAGFNDLATRFPDIAKEWDYSCNEGVLPTEVMFGARQNAHWVCSKGHKWISPITYRTSSGFGCPYCSNRKAWAGDNDLSSLFPDLAKEFDEKENSVSVNEVIPSSTKNFLWVCPSGHSYKASPSKRIKGVGCSVCSGTTMQAGINDLATTHPVLISEWDFKQNTLQPSEVTAGSNKKVYWICQQGHSYLSPIKNRVKGSGCNICSGRYVLAGFNDLASYSPEIASQWDFSKNQGVLPTEITRWNESKYWWICDQGHSYEATPGNRFMGKNCAVCYNRQIQVGVNDFASQFPELLSEWDEAKNLPSIPSQFVRGSGEKVWWNCPNGHSYQTSISNRTIIGVGCPECANAGYSTVRAGILYYIHHPLMLASKVGITNLDNRHSRLDGFAKEGWELIQRWEDPNGLIVLEAETQILRWLRKDLGLSPFLSAKEVGNLGGWSETFATDGVPSQVVIEKIQGVLKALKALKALKDQDSKAL